MTDPADLRDALDAMRAGLEERSQSPLDSPVSPHRSRTRDRSRSRERDDHTAPGAGGGGGGGDRRVAARTGQRKAHPAPTGTYQGYRGYQRAAEHATGQRRPDRARDRYHERPRPRPPPRQGQSPERKRPRPPQTSQSDWRPRGGTGPAIQSEETLFVWSGIGYELQARSGGGGLQTTTVMAFGRDRADAAQRILRQFDFTYRRAGRDWRHRLSEFLRTQHCLTLLPREQPGQAIAVLQFPAALADMLAAPGRGAYGTYGDRGGGGGGGER